MIEVTPTVSIEESALQFNFIRSTGPGGQNVNKVATAVQLRFDILNSTSLEPEVKQRLVWIAGNHVTEEGILIIEAKRFRTQEQNRADAIIRLVALVRKALKKPKPRRRTKPSKGAKEARLAQKKRRSMLKRLRSTHSENGDQESRL